VRKINKDGEQNSITMTEAKVIDVIYENGVFKPIEKVEPIEGAIMRVHIRKVVDILTATSGMFKSKYNKRARYDMYDLR
jgi:predicted DNA-binding antitoxin AbrB/MazE fold protein